MYVFITGSSMQSIQLGGANAPSIVTSFPLQTSDSFSPSSLGSFGLPVMGGTPPSSSVDMFGFPSGMVRTSLYLAIIIPLFLKQPSSSGAASITATMSSLKEITTEAVIAHGLLDDEKSTSSDTATSDHNLRGINMHLLVIISNGGWGFSFVDTHLISEVILYIICAFGTNESVLIREVSLSRGPPLYITL